MAIIIPELMTTEVSIGFEVNDIVTSGNSFRRRLVFEDRDDCSAADFTGYTPEFLLVNALGATVVTGTVTPVAGDATGIFLINLSLAQTTANIGTLAWKFTVDDGALINKTLFCGPFKITLCAAA